MPPLPERAHPPQHDHNLVDDPSTTLTPEEEHPPPPQILTRSFPPLLETLGRPTTEIHVFPRPATISTRADLPPPPHPQKRTALPPTPTAPLTTKLPPLSYNIHPSES